MKKGNISQPQVEKMLTLNDKQLKKLGDIYKDKNGNKSFLASRKRIIDELKLNAEESKIVANYERPKQLKPAKSPVIDMLELTPIQLEKLSGDEVILRIKN